jgi:hypothetical protein
MAANIVSGSAGISLNIAEKWCNSRVMLLCAAFAAFRVIDFQQ